MDPVSILDMMPYFPINRQHTSQVNMSIHNKSLSQCKGCVLLLSFLAQALLYRKTWKSVVMFGVLVGMTLSGKSVNPLELLAISLRQFHR